MEQPFSGQPVALKRELDLARAQRLRRLFLQLGGITWLTEQAGAIFERAPVITKELTLAVVEGQAERPGPDWALAPMDDRPLESEPSHLQPQIDISRSLWFWGKIGVWWIATSPPSPCPWRSPLSAICAFWTCHVVMESLKKRHQEDFGWDRTRLLLIL